MIRKLIICAILITIITVPVFAQSVTVSPPSGQAIESLTIGSNEGTSGTITFYCNDGSTIQGTWSYLTTFSVLDHSTIRAFHISMGSDSTSTTFITPGKLFIKFYQTKALLNGSQGIIRAGYGQVENLYYNDLETNSLLSPVIKVTFTADQDVGYTPEYWSLSDAEGNVAVPTDILRTLNEWKDYIFGFLPSARAFIDELFYWLKFFFIDNLEMIVALFLAVPMAFAAKNSRGNPEKFLRQYFKTLKGFFEFTLHIWTILLSSINTVLQWFKQWV